MCTKEVLVMRFLEGENLVDGIQQLGERAAQRQGLTLDDLKRDMLAKFEREGYPEPYSTVWNQISDAIDATLTTSLRRLDGVRTQLVDFHAGTVGRLPSSSRRTAIVIE